MANLPLALIGGVVMVFLSGGTLSVASLVGFITLFGIATRNGIMLISHYRHLMEEQGVGFRDAIVQGSMERLSPILMTALVTGVGLIPLALGAGEPGREIQRPMAVVILGGIVTSTLLNMIVIPALYLKYGEASSALPARDYPKGGGSLPPGTDQTSFGLLLKPSRLYAYGRSFTSIRFSARVLLLNRHGKDNHPDQPD